MDFYIVGTDILYKCIPKVTDWKNKLQINEERKVHGCEHYVRKVFVDLSDIVKNHRQKI